MYLSTIYIIENVMQALELDFISQHNEIEKACQFESDEEIK